MSTTSTSLEIILEALLFSSSEALPAAKLAAITGAAEEDVLAALDQLGARLQSGGIRLSSAHSTYRLVTAPEATSVVRQFLEDQGRQDLTKPALETLAIVAYKGPVTKSAVEAIRGVSSEAMLRNLIARGLVIEAGHSTEPGKPQLYTVSHTFLQHFGLTSTSDLPPLPEPTDAN